MSKEEDDKRKEFIEKWNKEHRFDQWKIVNPKKGSENGKEWVVYFTQKPYHENFAKKLSDFPTEFGQKLPKGQFIYTPHDCEFPDLANVQVGSIWACHGYREGRMCYDQWIVVAGENGTKSWQLFKRNI